MCGPETSSGLASSSPASALHDREISRSCCSPSIANLALISVGPRWCRLRQPSCQTFVRSAHRSVLPVSSSSKPSAKLDLPDPLRPTTNVRPGPGSNCRRASDPIPRNPSTAISCRKAWAGALASTGEGVWVTGVSSEPRCTASASGPSAAARTQSLTTCGSSASSSSSSSRSYAASFIDGHFDLRGSPTDNRRPTARRITPVTTGAAPSALTGAAHPPRPSISRSGGRGRLLSCRCPRCTSAALEVRITVELLRARAIVALPLGTKLDRQSAVAVWLLQRPTDASPTLFWLVDAADRQAPRSPISRGRASSRQLRRAQLTARIPNVVGRVAQAGGRAQLEPGFGRRCTGRDR